MKQVALVDESSQMSGVEFSTLYLARYLDRTRWSRVVICPEEGDLPERCRTYGINVQLVHRPSFSSTSFRVRDFVIPNPLAIMGDVGALVQAARRLAEYLRQSRPAIVVTKGLLTHFYGGLAARWAGIPCVWHVQDRVSERMGKLFPWILSIGARVLAVQVIADAESIARQLRTFVAANRIAVIWNGVDLDEFSPGNDGSGVRKEWGICPDDVLIGTVARLTAWKGQHVLINAFAQIAAKFPSARLVLVGSALFDGDQYARTLKADVARLGLAERVVFAGFRRDLPQVLAALDIVSHTSLEKDSSPLAVVSAMAAGKPIVCTRVDGTVELFENGVNGLLVPPGDVDALAEELGRLVSDATLRQKLGRAAREQAECKLSIQHFAEQCETVFERALA